jgi:hypothetical protein
VEPKRTCPECNLIFEAPPTETGRLTCPLCDTVFSATPPVAPLPTVPASSPQATAPLTAAQHVWKGCLAVAALLFVLGGLVYAYHLAGGLEKKAAKATPPEPTVAPSAPELPPVIEIIPSRPAFPPPVRPLVPEPEPPPLSPPPKPPSIAAEARPPLPLPERINLAIDRGLAYLQKHHKGHDQYRNYLGLFGLALLECGVSAKDPSVQQIAAWVRTRETILTATYELALAILFLDRLNDPSDRALIRTFGQRLVAGQLECGAWTYTCNDKQRRTPEWPAAPKIISRSHSNPLGGSASRPRITYRGDNSNTQFALLGLWVAQRHGVSARRALLAAEQYFRATQLSDGSWSYHPLVPHYRDSMTCAGLMALAMRYGVISGQGRDIRPDQPVQVSDRAIRQGLHFLGESLNKVSLAGDRITGVEARDPLYFLWSLERMAMIYDRKTIGDKEWYPWAAQMLIETQRPDGSWSAPYGGPVGTCFALLILKRSNLARDLQLAVPSEPTRRPSEEMQGVGERNAPAAPPGPTIIQLPGGAASGKKPLPSGGVPEMPGKKKM